MFVSVSSTGRRESRTFRCMTTLANSAVFWPIIKGQLRRHANSSGTFVHPSRFLAPAISRFFRFAETNSRGFYSGSPVTVIALCGSSVKNVKIAGSIGPEIWIAMLENGNPCYTSVMQRGNDNWKFYRCFSTMFSRRNRIECLDKERFDQFNLRSPRYECSARIEGIGSRSTR